MSRVWDMEDQLDKSGCFVNGFRNTPASREAYITVIDYPLLVQAINAMKNDWTAEDWLNLVETLESRAYLSPINQLTALEIRRQLGMETKNEEITEEDHE
jgi:hypothetical protein